MAARIFISYTGRDEVSKRVSKALFDHLNTPDSGLDAWLDVKRLDPGYKWHDVLTKNLVGSHAGVVLLTKEALESEWVLKEATYLKVRADGSPDFRVLTVLLDGLKPQDLAAEGCPFKTLHFNEDQLIHLLPEDDVPDKIVKGLDDVRRLWQAERPEDILIEDVQTYLKEVDEKILLRLAREMKLILDDWFPDGSLTETLARELARLMAASTPLAVASAIGQLAKRQIPKEDSETILECIYPFQVDGEGARCLARVADAATPCSAAGLNAEDPWTACLYIERASGNKWTPLEIDEVGDPEADDLVDQVRDILVSELNIVPKERLKEELPKYLASNTYVVIIPRAVSKEEVQQLIQEFSGVFFIVLAKGMSPDSTLCSDGVLEFLHPPLTDNRENEILDACDRAQNVLASHYKPRSSRRRRTQAA